MKSSGLLFVLAAALATSACGGGSPNPTAGDPPPTTPNISVSITPTSATIGAGGTQQFTTTVTGSTNSSTTWSMTSTVPSGQNPGTVSATGVYTAPATVTGTFTVTVTAAAVADTSATATATIAVNPPTVSISPTSATVSAGGTQQFTATVTSSANTAAMWSMTSTASLLPGQSPGTLSASGLYTAPAAVEGTFTVTVTAAAAADTSATATATITVNPPAIQPGLVWLETPGAADILGNIEPQLGMDGSGNVFFSAGVGSLSAWKLNPSGTVLSSFTSADALNPNAVVSDGTNFYIPSQLNGAPALLSLDSNLNKRYETTPCGASAQGWASAALWGGNSLGLWLALGSGSTPSFAVPANAATGQFPCSGGIQTNQANNSIVYSLTLSQSGNLTAFGFFPGSQSVCWSGGEGFLGQSTMGGPSVWLTPFSQIAPNTLAYITRAVETVESGKDVVYVAGAVFICAGSDPVWVAKYDATTGDLLWSETWDGGNSLEGAGVGGQPTPLPLPGGGVAVVASMTQVGEVPPANGHSTSDVVFAAWDADGKQIVATHVPIMNSADILIFGAALTPDGKGFYAGGTLFAQGEGTVMKFTFPAQRALTGN